MIPIKTPGQNGKFQPGASYNRLSLGFSKKLESLEAACVMFLAYYDFVWRTRNAEKGRTRLPATMAAGVTKMLMSYADLLDAVMDNGSQAIAA